MHLRLMRQSDGAAGMTGRCSTAGVSGWDY